MLNKRISLYLVLLSLAGCSDPKPIATLDNHGGQAYPGRRIQLFADATYANIEYSDLEGHENTTHGTYTITDAKTHLLLAPKSGPAENLYRMDFEDQHYWVPEQLKPPIMQPDEIQLRRRSLRGAL